MLQDTGMIYHLVCWDLPLVLLLEVHLVVKVKAQWTWKNRKLESLKIEEKEAETVTEIGIEGSEMEIEGQVKDGRIEVTGEVEDKMIEVEMTEEGHPDLEEMMIEDIEEILDGEEMMIGKTGETEEEMTRTLVVGLKAWQRVEQDLTYLWVKQGKSALGRTARMLLHHQIYAYVKTISRIPRKLQ